MSEMTMGDEPHQQTALAARAQELHDARLRQTLSALASVLWDIAGNVREQDEKAAGYEPTAAEGVRDRVEPQS